MKTESIPVTLVTGFLGAGKTTWLNGLLTRGIPPGSLILVNDFGDINVDADLIEYQDENILRLSNGCICCTLGGTLAEQLAEILRTPPHPAAIYIEASGIANPGRIVDTVTVSRRLYMEEVVCIVDASQAERYARDPRGADVWRQQIRLADRLVVNRLGADDELPPVIAQLREMVDSADGGSRYEISNRSSNTAPASASQSAINVVRKKGLAHAGRWQSCSVTYDKPIDGEWLERVVREYADVLVRAKGILQRSGATGMEAFQLSGTQIRWHPVARRTGKGQLVCIGTSGERFSQLVRALERPGSQCTE